MISVIIPCYNAGSFLMEAVESALKLKSQFEIIVVDDGSQDNLTRKNLNTLAHQGISVIYQQNAGPASARNAGIKVSKGKYILPLDADNILYASVFDEGLEIMEKNIHLSVLYTDAEYFGNVSGPWKVGILDKKRILIHNQVDTCTLIRKSDLLSVGGYDESREIMSNEDWELWIRMIEANKQFYYLEKVGFKYRVTGSSLMTTIVAPNYKLLRAYIIKKHVGLYNELLYDVANEMKKLDYVKGHVRKYKLKTIFKLLTGRDIF